MTRSARRPVSTAALLRLVGDGDAEERCAAILVLGTLRPDERRVVPALGRALDGAPPTIRPYIVDALARYGTPAALRRIVPLLDESGVGREQAVQVLGAAGPAALPLLRRRMRQSGSREAGEPLVQVAASVGTCEAMDLMVDCLADPTFGTARRLVTAIRERSSSWPQQVRSHLAELLVDRLARATGSEDRTAVIAALKGLGALGEARHLATVLDWVHPGHPLPVRQAAIESLGAAPWPGALRRKAAEVLGPVARAVRPFRLAAAAIRALARIDSEALDTGTLLDLAGSPSPDIADAALAALGSHAREAVAAALLAGLEDVRPGVRTREQATLVDPENVTERLVVAHGNARHAAHREAILALLARRRDRTDAATFRRLTRRLLATDLDPELLGQRLLLLAHVDRPALNRSVETRARRALAAGEDAHALDLLEPLVRNRLATPTGRYLAAVAHARQITADTGRASERHLARALQLMTPLERLPAFDLRGALGRERRIPAAPARRLARHFPLAGRLPTAT